MPPFDKRKLAALLQERRAVLRAAGAFSQRAIAKKLGVHESMVSKLIDGQRMDRPNMDLIRRLCREMEVDFDAFLTSERSGSSESGTRPKLGVLRAVDRFLRDATERGIKIPIAVFGRLQRRAIERAREQELEDHEDFWTLQGIHEIYEEVLKEMTEEPPEPTTTPANPPPPGPPLTRANLPRGPAISDSEPPSSLPPGPPSGHRVLVDSAHPARVRRHMYKKR